MILATFACPTTTEYSTNNAYKTKGYMAHGRQRSGVSTSLLLEPGFRAYPPAAVTHTCQPWVRTVCRYLCYQQRVELLHVQATGGAFVWGCHCRTGYLTGGFSMHTHALNLCTHHHEDSHLPFQSANWFGILACRGLIVHGNEIGVFAAAGWKEEFCVYFLAL
ncbi:hypothetical protein BD289DRAFT_446561 [Coniella lustricola]|uniref:Uncharacterized protein n=1 Tax=Coniella lustricola TaxID=2025994 RepID=A0A2T2ZTT6_9PEZI|nr:hypothetical protein BD289DRAFT_446561 [Coniella lustricola]